MPRASYLLLKPVSIDGIAIPKEILWGGFEREGFQELLRCPGRRGMSRPEPAVRPNSGRVGNLRSRTAS